MSALIYIACGAFAFTIVWAAVCVWGKKRSGDPALRSVLHKLLK